MKKGFLVTVCFPPTHSLCVWWVQSSGLVGHSPSLQEYPRGKPSRVQYGHKAKTGWDLKWVPRASVQGLPVSGLKSQCWGLVTTDLKFSELWGQESCCVVCARLLSGPFASAGWSCVHVWVSSPDGLTEMQVFWTASKCYTLRAFFFFNLCLRSTLLVIH